MPRDDIAGSSNIAAMVDSATSINPEIVRLAGLSLEQYEQERASVAEKLGYRKSALDKMVEDERAKTIIVRPGKLPGRELRLKDFEPWPEPVNGSEVLFAIVRDIKSYVVMTENQANAVALWVLATHAFDSFFVFPRLFFSAQAPNCGKTTALEVVTNLVPRALNASSISAAAMYRVIEQVRPSLMLDEADTFMRDNEDLRGVINAGHRRDGAIIRCVETKEDYETREFSAWAPVALAAIGHLPSTIEDRSIIIKLSRKLDSEQIQSLRIDRTDNLAIHARCAARWAQNNADTLAVADPEIPSGIINRTADNWRPLLAVADAAGGIWPAMVRDVAVDLCGAGGPKSIAELLLADLCELFETDLVEIEKYPNRFTAELNACKPTELFTREIMKALHDRDDRSWSEFGKDRKPITPPQLANLLRKLGVKKVGLTVRRGDETAKGYKREWLDEAFTRYL
jgi:putative DNA primase/helicase